MDTNHDTQVREAARTLAKLGASKGGKARAAAMTPEERRESARKAVNARWARQKAQAHGAESDEPAA